jgi:pimeloyl-ACP methyl ester carboxylesterase
VGEKVTAASVGPAIPPPSACLALTEVHRTVVDMISLRMSRKALSKVPSGDGHGVMVLPGFMGDDGYNSAFRRFLSKRNYAVQGWGLGRNLGPRDGVLEAMSDNLEDLYDESGGPVSLVGHSLGGIYARELARSMPDKVRQVISLGSPFGEGRVEASYPGRLFAAMNPMDELPLDQDLLSVAPPVPTTAVYSHGDGIVNWRTAVQHKGHEQTQNIRIRGSHCGMTLNPTVWFLVAERLAQSEGDWKPFVSRSWSNALHPAA